MTLGRTFKNPIFGIGGVIGLAFALLLPSILESRSKPALFSRWAAAVSLLVSSVPLWDACLDRFSKASPHSQKRKKKERANFLASFV